MNLAQIRQEAEQKLQENETSFRKPVLIHAAVIAGVSLLLLLVSYLAQNFSSQGGLSNMGTQNLLSTAQTLLQMVNMIALPFWNAGLIFCALRMLRRKDHAPAVLTEGFRRWGPIAGSLLYRGLIYFLVIMGCYFLSSIAISLLPLPASLIDNLVAFIKKPVFPLSTDILVYIGVCMIIYIASMCILLVPKMYLHRLAVYHIMDDAPCGGLQSVMRSSYFMKGQRKNLFLLDLSFWWFYLIEVLIGLLSISDLILTGLGIPLPFGAQTAALLFPILGLLARLVLYYYAQPIIAATYAVFYEKVSTERTNNQEPVDSKPMPWKY